MSIRFHIPPSPLQALDQSIDTSIAPKKTGIFRLVLQVGHGVVAGGRQLRGILMRLVNAKGISAARSLTSSADTVSIARPLGLKNPRGSEGDSSERIGLGIMRSQSDGQGSMPSAHLENARRNLRLTLLASQSHHNRLDSPVPSQSNEGADVQNHRSSVPSPRILKSCRLGFLSSAKERLRPDSSDAKELEEIHAVMGGESLVHCVKHVSRSAGSSFWSITTPDGLMWSMERVSAQDSQANQILFNELNALRRVRCVDGLPWLEEVDNKKETRFILLKWMGDHTLLSLLRNDKLYHASFTINQMARLLHAIHCMHQCGVIHLKVSPENIMITGIEGDLTLFDFSSCIITNAGAMIDGDIPLWIHDPALGPNGELRRRTRSPYYNDYVALGYIWHEMRTGLIPTDDGSGKHRVKEELLLTDEMFFIRRLLSTDDYYRFNSVGEMKAHAIFKNIDWHSFES